MTVEGAHQQLQAMQFTKNNIRWCCGDETQTTFEGFAFFPGKELSKILHKNIGLGLCNGSKIAVYLTKNFNVLNRYTELCWQKIVMGDVRYYKQLISQTIDRGFDRDTFVIVDKQIVN